MREIHLNFLSFKNQDLGVAIYRKKVDGSVFLDKASHYDLPDANGINQKYEVIEQERVGYELFKLPPYLKTGLIAKKIFGELKTLQTFFPANESDPFNYRLYTEIEKHPKGKKCIWVEPYFLKSKRIWGLQIGFRFIVNPSLTSTGFKIDKDILIASGTLNSKGYANFDYYLFKHSWLTLFLKDIAPIISQTLSFSLAEQFLSIPSYLLKPKQYIFDNLKVNASPYLGLIQNKPLQNISEDTQYLFLYKKEDRDFAASLLKGLRGETFPSVFTGMEKVFKIPFRNDRIRGVGVQSFDEETIQSHITQIKTSGSTILPIIILLAKKDEENDRIYFLLKHRFTNAGIPCQVVTKELIVNDNALKYSLGNIGLQIFAKAGGKPWKMKAATSDGLIIGIGQSYNIEKTTEGNSVEKNITYSILTDSSGIFKDLQVLSEGLESDADYYHKIVASMSRIIQQAGYKKVTLHVPFRISKEKILDKVIANIGDNIELSVLVINSKTDHLGFDYENNGLVPFESTFVKLSSDEYLVWFEGLSYNNPKITKRFGHPLLIKFWYSNIPERFKDNAYKENLLQDCINLSGANWRGFKAKQLPVSIFYCQRIAEFIGKFREYHLDHIEINNLKPWFL